MKIKTEISDAVDRQAKELNLYKNELVEMILARHYGIESLADLYLDGTPPCFEVEAGGLDRDKSSLQDVKDRQHRRFFSYNR